MISNFEVKFRFMKWFSKMYVITKNIWYHFDEILKPDSARDRIHPYRNHNNVAIEDRFSTCTDRCWVCEWKTPRHGWKVIRSEVITMRTTNATVGHAHNQPQLSKTTAGTRLCSSDVALSLSGDATRCVVQQFRMRRKTNCVAERVQHFSTIHEEGWSRFQYEHLLHMYGELRFTWGWFIAYWLQGFSTKARTFGNQ